MKKFKYMLSVLALALVLTCVMKATPAAAADIAATVDYASLTVEISNAEKQVYYQVVKSASDTKGKVAAWLPATKDGAKYKIDISAFSKGGAILYTTDNTKEAGTVVEIKGTASAVKGTIDFSVEGNNAIGLQQVFATLIVTDDKKADKKYDKSATTAAADLTALNNAYLFQWKRGANGVWNDADVAGSGSDNFQTEYSMMRTSNSTLYVRAYAKVSDKKGSLPSKEAKIKIAKTATAPTIKVDYAKGTIALKNGMEFRYSGKTYYIPEYSKTESTNDAVISKSSKATKTKVSALTPAQIIAGVKSAYSVDIADGAAVTLEVRTSATAKKYASWYATVTLKAPIAVPEKTGDALATYTYDAYNKTLIVKIGAFTAVTGRTLEYAIAGDDADISSLKFTAVTDASKDIDLSKMIGKKFKYTNTKGEKKEQVYEKNVSDTVKTVVYIRWAAVVDKDDASKNIFASKADSTTQLKAPATVNVTAATNTVTGVTATEIKDAMGNTFSTTAIAVTKDTKMTLYIKPTVTAGYTVTAVKVKLADGSDVTATWDAKAKAWVAKDVVAAKEGALTVTYTITAPTPTPAPTSTPAG